jgi:hypothetical protein
MAIIQTFIDEQDGTEYIIIANKDGSTTSMLKSTYDAQAKELTESVTDDSTGNK